MDVLFISEEKIKSYTNLNTNIAPEELAPYIWDAQQIMLPNFLGGTYYNALKERVLEGTTTSADEYLLDNYIGPYLCNQAFYTASTFLNYRAYNKGILKNFSESGNPMELEELKFFQSQLKNIAEGFAGQMVLYLTQHPSDFPEYASWNLKDGQAPDRSNPYTANITIPNYNSRKSRLIRRLTKGDDCGFDPCGDTYNLPR